MRGRKYSIVRCSPSRSWIFGSHPSWARAFVMSGWRCLGSSDGSGRVTIGELTPNLTIILDDYARFLLDLGIRVDLER